MQRPHARFVTSAAFWWAVAIFVVTFLPYLRTSAYGFINLDDIAYIQGSEHVQVGLTLGGIKWALAAVGYNAIWMPLTWISFMTDVSLWGVNAGAMHIVNALFHAANAVLLFLLLRLVLRNLRPPISDLRLAAVAGLAALFWSLHPLRVEPVAWIASRKDVLSVFWELLAFIFWAKAVIADGAKEGSREGAETRDGGRGCAELPNAKTYAECVTSRSMPSDLRSPISTLRPPLFRALALFCFAFACMSKPTAMTFPVLAGFLEFLLAHRVRWGHYTVPFLGALGVAWIAQYSQAAGGATQTLAHVPFYGRLLNAVSAFGSYCWQTVWPVQLTAAHVHKWPNLPLFLGPGLLICTVYGVGLVILFWRSGACRLLLDELPASVRRVVRISAPTSDFRFPTSDWARCGFVGLSWFLVAVAPMLGLLGFGFHSHADRFTYLSAIGFSLVLAFVWAVHLGSKMERLLNIALVVTLGVWFGLTWWQVGFWKNDKTLFLRALEVDPSKNYVAHRNLGLFYYGTERELSCASQHFEQALQINREFNRIIQLYFILTLAENGSLERAKEETRDLAQWKEDSVRTTMKQDINQKNPSDCRILDTFIAYAMIAHFEKDDELANKHLDYVLRFNPKNEEAHYIKGLIAYDNKHFQEAVEHWRICLVTTTGIPRPYLKKVIAEVEQKKERMGMGMTYGRDSGLLERNCAKQE